MKQFLIIAANLFFLSHFSMAQDRAYNRFLKISHLVPDRKCEEAEDLIEKGLQADDGYYFIIQYYKAACIYHNQRDIGQIDSLLQIALQVKKSHKEYKLCKGNSYWLYSTIYDDNLETEKSKINLRQALKYFDKKSSEYSSLISNLGLLEIQTGENEKALITFTKAIEISPSNAYAYNNRALANINLENYKEAKTDLDKSVLLKADNPYVYKNYALYFLGQRRPSKACLMLAKADKFGYFELGYGDKNLVRDLQKTHCN